MIARVLVVLIKGYQKSISRVMAPACRFYPSCSAYAIEALQVHGAVKGLYLALRRVTRCHPFNPGGVDRVPPKEASAR